MNKKGFTLIEILVVVAIIGLLSAVVLVSVGGARTKSANTGIKLNLKKIVAVVGTKMIDAGVNTIPSGMAGVDCKVDAASSDSDYNAFCKALNKSGATNIAINASAVGDVAASANLVGSSAGNWCVDSSGKEGPGTAISGSCQ